MTRNTQKPQDYLWLEADTMTHFLSESIRITAVACPSLQACTNTTSFFKIWPLFSKAAITEISQEQFVYTHTHTLRGRKYSGYMMMTTQPVTPKTTCSSSPAGCKKTHTHLSLHFCYTPQPICYGNSEYWKEMPSFLILHVTRQLRESRKKRRESESYYCQQLRCLLTVLR